MNLTNLVDKFFKTQSLAVSSDTAFVFSVHKSGSSMLFGILNDYFERLSIPSIDLPDFFFTNNIDDASWQDSNEVASKIKSGYIYYGFRYFPRCLLQSDARLLETSKSILLYRDPADTLVSQYFSFNNFNAHVKNETKQFLADTAKFSGTIDEYVLLHSDLLLFKLKEYYENLNTEMTKIVCYEDLFYDKYFYVEEILKYFSLRLEKQVLSEVCAAHDIRPESERVGLHIRIGHPGDSRNKLSEETLMLINEKFFGTLSDYIVKFKKLGID